VRLRGDSGVSYCLLSIASPLLGLFGHPHSQFPIPLPIPHPDPRAQPQRVARETVICLVFIVCSSRTESPHGPFPPELLHSSITGSTVIKLLASTSPPQGRPRLATCILYFYHHLERLLIRGFPSFHGYHRLPQPRHIFTLQNFLLLYLLSESFGVLDGALRHPRSVGFLHFRRWCGHGSIVDHQFPLSCASTPCRIFLDVRRPSNEVGRHWRGIVVDAVLHWWLLIASYEAASCRVVGATSVI